ncbi:hypothetical protein VTO73DRAFT_11325 [Trametes versicolor]
MAAAGDMMAQTHVEPSSETQTVADRVDAPLGSLKHNPDLWFEDGSIVVIAENTGFRVHKLLLSHLSPVFRDVFMVPQPVVIDSGLSVVENCPVVRVSDSVYDMKYLLRAIYDGRGYLTEMSPYIPFPVISALMRLGHKYEIKGFCSEDIDATFDFTKDEEGAELFEAVNLARLTGKFAILPLALYKCCQRDVAEIMFGIEREAGGVVRLSQDDIERCVRARERLLRESCELAGTIASAKCPARRCMTPRACPRHLERLRETFTSMLGDLVNTAVLSGLREQLGEFTVLPEWTQLCHECRDELISQHKLKQRQAWGKLLEILDLSDQDLGIEWAGPWPSWDRICFDQVDRSDP